MFEELKFKGYKFDDPWDIVDLFEKKLAEYAGSKYAVCVDSCSNAIFLCLKYLQISNQTIDIPKNTYASVPMQCIHAGNVVNFIDKTWQGYYQLTPTPIVDSATRFTKNMYIPDTYYCLSFHHRKILNIGKGGAILTDDKSFVDWAMPMIYDGRHRKIKYDDDSLECIGYHMYMTPEDAAKGLLLFENIKDHNADIGSDKTYKDLSTQPIFKKL
jgi:dTDP-4-amino-4,6-dideoxygalactose transaminase